MAELCVPGWRGRETGSEGKGVSCLKGSTWELHRSLQLTSGAWKGLVCTGGCKGAGEDDRGPCVQCRLGDSVRRGSEETGGGGCFL